MMAEGYGFFMGDGQLSIEADVKYTKLLFEHSEILGLSVRSGEWAPVSDVSWRRMRELLSELRGDTFTSLPTPVNKASCARVLGIFGSSSSWSLRMAPHDTCSEPSSGIEDAEPVETRAHKERLAKLPN